MAFLIRADHDAVIMDWKRVLAREWLIFLASLVAPSAILLPLIHFLGEGLSDFRAEDLQELLLIGLSLWALVILIRSIVWSIKTLRKSE